MTMRRNWKRTAIGLGKELKDFKLQFAKEIDFPNKIPQLGVFDFRDFSEDLKMDIAHAMESGELFSD